MYSSKAHNMQEGVIQYQQHWQKAAPSALELIAPLEAWRARLFEQKLIGVYPDGLGYGNMSMRHGDGFIITGTQTGHLPVLGPEQYTRVTAVDIEANTLWCEGPVRASSEGLSHAACYALDESIMAVFHAHSKAMWKHFMHVWPTTPEHIPYGTPEMANAVLACWKNSTQPMPFPLVMAGHDEGIIVAAPTLDEAGAFMLSACDEAS